MLRLTTQKLEVVGKRPCTGAGEVLADGASKEENQDDCRRNPKGTV